MRRLVQGVEVARRVYQGVLRVQLGEVEVCPVQASGIRVATDRVVSTNRGEGLQFLDLMLRRELLEATCSD